MKERRERVTARLDIGTPDEPKVVELSVFDPLPRDRRAINALRLDAIQRARQEGLETVPWDYLEEAGQRAAERLGLDEAQLASLSVTEQNLALFQLARWATEPDLGN